MIQSIELGGMQKLVIMCQLRFKVTKKEAIKLNSDARKIVFIFIT